MKVKIYSTESCPACIMAKQFLNNNNVEYESLTVGVDISSEDFFKETNSRGVPVIIIGNEQLNGFNQHKMKDLLKL